MKVDGIRVRDVNVAKILQKLSDQGAIITQCNNSHYKILPPDKSKGVCFLPSTPSDLRGLKNGVSALRRAGFNL